MPALKASGEATEVELPRQVWVSFEDQAGRGPKESFDRIAKVQEEIDALHRYVK